MATTEFDSFEILGDFVLCEDESDESVVFVTTVEDDRMSKDNLKFFRIVKLPRNEHSKMEGDFKLSIGDSVISITTGMDVRLDGKLYKMFESKYITAKKG